MKIIKFTAEDGESWGLPLSVVAKNRADYYVEKDKDTTFQTEYDFIMNDTFEGIDWLNNDMNTSDFEDKLFQISKPAAVSFMEKFNGGTNGSTEIEEYQDET